MRGKSDVRIHRLFLMFLSFCACQPAGAVSTNYCHDPEAAQEGARLSTQYDHPEFKALYTLRKNLCEQVDNGTMSIDDAIDRFENERAQKIDQLRKRLDQNDRQEALAG